MTGTTISSAGLDARRRRALFRAWHRGTREMDLVLGGFADAEIARLSEDELAQFEALLDVLDDDLFKWVTREKAVPAEYDTPLLRKIGQARHAAAQ